MFKMDSPGIQITLLTISRYRQNDITKLYAFFLSRYYNGIVSPRRRLRNESCDAIAFELSCIDNMR